MLKKSGILWLCENARKLEKFSGRWVMFNLKEGVVSSGESLERMFKLVKKHKKFRKPFIFHVPTKDELGGVAFLSAHKN